MTGEPLALALAGWPLALAVAGLALRDQARERRRRRVLNERLHELRRPMQALVLSARPRPDTVPDPLGLALAALRDLDAAVNGRPEESRRHPIPARELAVAAARRSRASAARAGRVVRVRWRCGHVVVEADPIRISQALDNLVANALEHGRGPVLIEGRRAGSRLDLLVRDAGPGGGVAWRERRDPRHGHGLRLAAAAARAHGGALTRRTGARGTVATLRLRVADAARTQRRPAPLDPAVLPGPG